MNTDRKELRKTFVFDHTTQDKVDCIKDSLEEEFGSNLSEGQVIRKIINDFYKTFEKTRKVK